MAIGLFLLLICSALVVSYVVGKKHGAVTNYLAFCWLPLAIGYVWTKVEFYLIPYHILAISLTLAASFTLSLIGALMLVVSRKRLNFMKMIALTAAAFVYAIPSLLFILLSISGTR